MIFFFISYTSFKEKSCYFLYLLSWILTNFCTIIFKMLNKNSFLNELNSIFDIPTCL